MWEIIFLSDDDCCNNCEEVLEAYRKKGWALSNPDNIDQARVFSSQMCTFMICLPFRRTVSMCFPGVVNPLDGVQWTQHTPNAMYQYFLKVLLFLLLVASNAADFDGICDSMWPLTPRPHSVSVSEFGAVGDGKTMNTVAFQNAIFYLKSFTDKGGAQLYVPAGKWLTGCINLTSHLTLFLEKDAVILGSEVETETVGQNSYGNVL